MTPQALFQAYVHERRLFAPTGYRLDRLDGLTRLTPLAEDLDGAVMFSELSIATVDEAITEQMDYFQRIGRSFEWKVYAFDSPPDLARRLEQRGFVAGEREAFMVHAVAALPELVPTHACRIERVTADAGLDHIVAVQEAVWGRPFPWLKSALAGSLPYAALFCAYEEERPIGTGWIDFPEHSSFGELHGGAVLAQYRGRGIYSAIHRVRMIEAKSRGFAYVAVDAAPMSRPLLLQKGFMPICDTTPYLKPANQPGK